jgi:hypothetical protein
MRKNHTFLLGLVLMTSILIATQGFAQIKMATIKGTVKDEVGELLPGVSVELRGEALMGTRTVITDSEGGFRFPALPIGKNYELTLSMDGFQTLTRKNLRLTIGATLVLEIELKPSAIKEQVTVTAEAPVVDIEKTSFSANIDSDFLLNLPTGRYMNSVVKMTPGVTSSSQGSSRVSSYGSLVKSNAYYLNGVDISAPSTGAAWLAPQIDLVEEYEVTGVGAPAEYGNFQGAVINCVSRSGSNTFSGSAKLFLRHEDLTANNTPDEKWPYHIAHWHDAIFSLGGPIIEDKLWFFLYGKYILTKDTGVGADPDYPSKYRDTIIIGRFDWQLNEKNKLSVFFQANWYHWSESPTAYHPYETIAGENDWLVVPTAEWLSIWSDKTFFELKYASWFCYLWYDPIDGDLTTPGRVDWGTGYWSDNHQYFYHWWTNRIQANATVSHFADDFIQGDHEFKFGVQFNRGYSDIIEGYWGGVAYFDWMGYPYAAYFWDPHHVGGIVHQIGGFIDDSWRISDRLTLNVGVRFDYNHGWIPDYDELDINHDPTGTVIPGVPDVGNWTTISPRFGLNYQLTPDRKTVFRATYGRYYDALIIGDWHGATPAQAPWYAYGYNWSTGEYDILWYVWEPLEELGIDEDLKPPYTDQFSLALEREILPNFSLSATFIYKDSLNVIARMNTASQYQEIPFYDEYSGQTITVFNQMYPIQNFYLITNPGDKMTYRGLMLVANKRFSNNFQIYSSFTWSKTWNIPKGYRDRNDLINAEGPPSYGAWRGAVDRRWAFKFAATYAAPLGIVLGTNIAYQQGQSWQRTVRVPLNQGFKEINAEPRGSERFPEELYLDVRAEKVFRLGSRVRAKISLDVFNLFNRDTNLDWVSTQAESPNYLVPTRIVSPRIAMVGLQLEF